MTSPVLSSDPGRLYVYAQRPGAVRSWIPISAGSGVIAELKEGRFFVLTLDRGRYTFTPENGVPVTVDFSAAEEIWLRLDWNHQIGRSPIPVLSRVPPARADQETRHLAYIDGNRIHSGLVSKTDPREPRERRLIRRSERDLQ